MLKLAGGRGEKSGPGGVEKLGVDFAARPREHPQSPEFPRIWFTRAWIGIQVI